MYSPNYTLIVILYCKHSQASLVDFITSFRAIYLTVMENKLMVLIIIALAILKFSLYFLFGCSTHIGLSRYFVDKHVPTYE